ncbi:DUF3073 domain-containing protein [Ornithinimicrobium sp. Y1694]|uniref:DUF3073 domain-containing protein n=1 Tax=Ornithinimicrobium sp. Y1694 TaxID=3418590 RepID=UPI003CF4C3CE
MGRGRAKAKQIKVARKLKYNSGPSTDLSALERELHGASGNESYDSYSSEEESEEDDDPYAAYADDDDEGEDDYGSWAAGDQR